VLCSVNKKPEDLHHVFLAKGHKPDVNSTERQARKMYFEYCLFVSLEVRLIEVPLCMYIYIYIYVCVCVWGGGMSGWVERSSKYIY
jgi:hypothetical protein